ncbi:Wzz/FepE/Etk N-terminal domain-containing protein [Olivibacter sitiensis]|uniref:Wzz/FepE/Etk N-terminal domain-containing protein n=1 Tax=Olivibacter sitiensis TaxID=376470 RepID=UPI00041CE8BC|nr:Wzz/FepE/Etk N-terminal domain-containing protein [Olivibacter sitiensis]
MQESNTNSHIRQNADDEISLKELLLKIQHTWRYLLGKWYILAIAVIIGAVLGLCYSLFTKTKYTATTTFVLEEDKGSSGMGSMAGLASMIGVNLGGMEGAGLFSGDNIMEFLKSKRMIYRTLFTPVTVGGKQQLMADWYADIYGYREKWSEIDTLKDFQFIPNKLGDYKQDAILSSFHKEIIKDLLTIEKPDKKLNILSLSIETLDERFSQQFSEALLANASNFYIQTKTKKAEENLTVLTHQVDSVRRELNEAISGVAMATEANPNANTAFSTLRVPSQRRQVDVTANSAILTELVKQQELAKITLRNNKPLIQVLDRPYLPLEKSRVGKMKGMFIGGFLVAFLTTLYLLAKRILQSIMAE